MPGQYKCSTHLYRNAAILLAATPATCISFFVDELRPLLGRTLVLVAHPDDEAAGCGALLQRMEDPIVLFATDGAPRSDFFWQNYNSREEYASARAREAEEALTAVGVEHFHFLCDDEPITDQELYLHLDRAYEALRELLESEMPEAILSLAYEGGHPDHDACAFLACSAGEEFHLPVWEMPLYQRASGSLTYQRFLDDSQGCELDITRPELVRKMNMFARYESQSEVLRDFLPYVERFRPMRAYDFSQPPHPGRLNYEAWGWPIKGADLCHAFTRLRNSWVKKFEWGTAA